MGFHMLGWLPVVVVVLGVACIFMMFVFGESCVVSVDEWSSIVVSEGGPVIGGEICVFGEPLVGLFLLGVVLCGPDCCVVSGACHVSQGPVVGDIWSLSSHLNGCFGCCQKLLLPAKCSQASVWPRRQGLGHC